MTKPNKPYDTTPQLDPVSRDFILVPRFIYDSVSLIVLDERTLLPKIDNTYKLILVIL